MNIWQALSPRKKRLAAIVGGFIGLVFVSWVIVSGSPEEIGNTRHQNISVKPGAHKIIDVAVRHPNRIITPFKVPHVVTSASAVVETSEHVIYVVPEDSTPITMFMNEAGDESSVIRLTLLPKKTPPREYRLRVKPGISLPYAARMAAQSLPDNHQVMVAGVAFDRLVRGQIPYGSTFSEQAPYPHPLCAVESGLQATFEDGQHVLGENQEIYIGVVRNSGQAKELFQESWCDSPGVIAVALWPHANLQPGEAAEIYLARTLVTSEPVNSAVARPSLIGVSR